MEKFKKVITVAVLIGFFIPIGAVVTGLRMAAEFFHFRISNSVVWFLRRMDHKIGPKLVDKFFNLMEGVKVVPKR